MEHGAQSAHLHAWCLTGDGVRRRAVLGVGKVRGEPKHETQAIRHLPDLPLSDMQSAAYSTARSGDSPKAHS